MTDENENQQGENIQEDQSVPEQQIDPVMMKEVGERMAAYIDKVKETEHHGMVNMAVLNIRMENFRRNMMMGGAPKPVIDEYLQVMQLALDMVGELVDVEGNGGSARYESVRNDIIKSGEDITKAVMNIS